VDVEIILNQHDGACVRKVDVGQILKDVSVVDCGVAGPKSFFYHCCTIVTDYGPLICHIIWKGTLTGGVI